jgi:hypothetical protein
VRRCVSIVFLARRSKPFEVGVDVWSLSLLWMRLRDGVLGLRCDVFYGGAGRNAGQ